MLCSLPPTVRFFEPRKIVPLPAIEPTVVPAEFNPAIVMNAVGFALTSAAFPPDEPRINSVNELFPLFVIVAFPLSNFQKIE